MRDPGDPWWMSWPVGPILGSAVVVAFLLIVQWVQHLAR